MLLLLRKIFFYVFAAIFLFFSPVLVFYSLGYWFQPGEVQGIVKTGLVYLETVPEGATVYIGKRRFAHPTPTEIRELRPGEYSISLVQKGYRDWTRTIPIVAGKATVLDKILLVPSVVKQELLAAGDFKDFVTLKGTDDFLLFKGDRLNDLYVFDGAEEKFWPLWPQKNRAAGDAKVLSYYWQPQSYNLLLHVEFAAERKYLWVRLEDEKARFKDITRLFVEEPERIDWDHEEGRHLFLFQQNHLNRLDVSSGLVYPRFLEHLRGYGFFEKQIYALEEGGMFFRSDLNGKNRDIILDDAEVFRFLFGEKDFFQVRVLAKGVILFLGPDGQLVGNRLPYHYVRNGVLGFDFFNKDHKLLLWKKQELGVMTFPLNTWKEEVFEKGPKIEWIFRGGNKIRSAFWVYEGTHVLFQDEDRVFLLEPEISGERQIQELLRVKKDSSIYYLEKSGKLYYLDKGSQGLYSMTLIPKENLLTLSLAEIDKGLEKTNRRAA
jgi:hypothetical protein